MRNSLKINRLLLCGIMLFFSIVAADGKTIDDVSGGFSAIFNKLSRLASPDFSAMSVDSARMLLMGVQKRIKGIHTILRINSVGTVINEISSTGGAMPMRSVADQKWFVEVKNRNKSYFGTSRESGRVNPLLFWALPMQTGSGIFGGVLAIKLDAGPVCSSICENDSLHFAAFFNESLLFRCGNDRYTFTDEAIWILPDSSRIILRYGDAGTALQKRQNQDEKKADEAVVESDDFYSNAKDDNKRNDFQEIQPQVVKKTKKGLNFFIYILLLGAVISGVLLIKAVLGKNKLPQKQCPGMVENCDNPDTFDNSDNSDNLDTSERPGIPYRNDSNAFSLTQQEVIIRNGIEENGELIDDNEDDETEHHLARETCEKIKAIISNDAVSDVVSAASSEVPSTDEALRREMYKEIHGQIMHWVNYESSRLSQSLQELSDRVGKLENVNSSEVMRIRNEAQRISKEIASFKDNAPDQVQSEETPV